MFIKLVVFNSNGHFKTSQKKKKGFKKKQDNFFKKIDAESMLNILSVGKKRNDSSSLILIFVKHCGSQN